MPKRKPEEWPVNDPYWPDFVEWIKSTHGSLHDHWYIQWEPFLAGVNAAAEYAGKLFGREQR